MTERKIVIKTCEECPHIDADNKWTEPFCVKKERILPSTQSRSPANITTYKTKYEIPEWCPLEENDK